MSDAAARDGYVVIAPEKTLARRLERLRHHGARGGFIPRHRALLSSPSHPRKLVPSFLLAGAFLLAMYLAQGGVARLWLAVMEFWRVVFGMSGYSTMIHYRLGGIPFDVPYLHFPAGMPDGVLWWIGAVAAALVLVVSLLLPNRFLPLSYLLRIVGFFQTTAQVFFAFWMDRFPYAGDGYVHGMLIAGMFLLAMIPPVLGLTYYLFDFSLGRKMLLTALMLGHFLLLIPLQYFLHAWLMYHYSLLLMPLLFFIGGLPLNVMAFIAMFGWGFSWRDRLHDEAVQMSVRR